MKPLMMPKIHAVAVEIWCPFCRRDDPIPARDGSFMHDSVPAELTCPDCQSEFKIDTRTKIERP